MYAICETKNDDVKACIKEMLKLRYAYPLIQVGQKLYQQCRADRSKASEVARNKKRRFAINMGTGMIHRERCSILERTNKDHIIGAYLVKPKTTGLKMCKHCN